MKKSVEKIKSEIIYHGPVKLRIDTLNANGKIIRKEVVEHNPSVGILPILNQRDILLIQQYRHAINKQLIEIPAGKIEMDEIPIESARRELEEETGYTGNLIPISQSYIAPGYDTEMIHFFIAKDIHKITDSPKMDEDENIVNFVIDLKDAIKYCLDGTIQDCKTVSLILLYYNILQGNEEIR